MIVKEWVLFLSQNALITQQKVNLLAQINGKAAPSLQLNSSSWEVMATSSLHPPPPCVYVGHEAPVGSQCGLEVAGMGVYKGGFHQHNFWRTLTRLEKGEEC